MDKNIKQFKEIRIFLLVIGGCYILFGVFALLMVRLQQRMIGNAGLHSQDGMQNKFPELMSYLWQTWDNYMPYLVVLGIAYLLFAWMYGRVWQQAPWILGALTALGLVFSLGYTQESLVFTDAFFEMIPEEDEFVGSMATTMTRATSVMGYVQAVGYMVVPQAIVAYKMRKLPASPGRVVEP